MSCKIRIQVGDKTYPLLTWTQDMACWSYSLPAMDSCPMAKADGPNDICSSCYARLGRYNMSNVASCQYARFEWTKYWLKTDPKYWISFMTDAIRTHSKDRFRVHDSGDFFRPDYIIAWMEVCKNLPSVNFWFPTRAWRATSLSWQAALQSLASLKNVTVRPSALQFNDEPPDLNGLSKGTTVYLDEKFLHKKTMICPKTVNGGSCETNKCFSCWNDKVRVGYLIHGRMGRQKPAIVSDKENRNRRSFKEKFATLTVGKT